HEDRAGILFEGRIDGTSKGFYEHGKSIIGSGAEFYESTYSWVGKPPLMFDPPLEFGSGEELLVYLSCVQDGDEDMSENLADVALILEVIRE
ncbi:unnamed protein product, partial [marine sediment metagenome]